MSTSSCPFFMKPVNLKHLAEALQLSIGTVSRALNDRYDISQATKERVRALAEELNYTPNSFASNLRRNKSNTIGVIVPEVANPFFSLALNGIEELASRHNYHVIIQLSREDNSHELAVMRQLVRSQIDGLLWSVASGSQNSAQLEVLRDRGIPVVLFDRVHSGYDVPTVTTDDYESSYQATRHLLEAGCRVIAHLAIAGDLSISQRRWLGYCHALRDYGLPLQDELVVHETAAKPAAEIVRELLLLRPDIDGIFAAVESLAMGSYEVCQALGCRIPEDIKIVSFSNLKSAALLAPALTTVTQPAHSIGKEAARILFRAITKSQLLTAAQSVELKSELHRRASTASDGQVPTNLE
jgi:LacI family transcriptional regulator